MSLGLGIGISRQGGPLNPDGLSLDLAFALDKTLTARQGPTPAFTRASTATFVGSNGLIQSAANDIPRFDHDPVTLACKGLLIEEQRTNLVSHSANFKQATSSNFWENLSATTVTVDQTASPDGGVNADLLTTSVASFDCFTRKGGITIGSTQYSYSIFLKKGSSNHRFVGFYIGVGINNLKFPFFDFDNPTTVQIPSGTMVGTINSTKVEEYPNDWYRVSITYTTASSPVTGFLGVYISSSNGDVLASNTAGLNAFIWGIQVELGAFPTSYIPTKTAALTRSVDVCSITGGDFTSFYNQSEGTLFASGIAKGYLVLASSGINSNQVAISSLLSLQRLRFDVANAGVYTAQVESGIISQGSFNKTAGSYATNDARSAFNGTLGTADTSVTVPINLTTLHIGKTAGINFPANGTVARLQYFRKRLANAKLQALTT